MSTSTTLHLDLAHHKDQNRKLDHDHYLDMEMKLPLLFYGDRI
jgi:hypothetical protein